MTPEEPPAAHHEWFCDRYMEMERRDLMRACFSTPPGHAKTKFFTRYGPAWYLGRNPNHRYLQGGHSQAFAENEFGKYVRDIIADPRYREVFPNIDISSRSGAAGNWRLDGGRGGYVTKGAGQSIAGYRAHIGGIDDPFGSREDAQSPTIRAKVSAWLFTDFRTRLLPFSPLFIVATRWHPEDLIGLVENLNKQNKGLKWQIFNLSAVIESELEMAQDPMGRGMGEALWPEFYGIDELMELKATLPSNDWFALYKGQPRDIEGNAVKSGWFQRYTSLPSRYQAPSNYNPTGTPNEIKRVVISVDCANKDTARAAYTVITVWIEDFHKRHYLAEVVRKKMEFMEMVSTIESTAIRWDANAILVEDQGAGTQYIQQRATLAPAPVIKIDVDNKSKEFRFDGVLPMIESGQVYLPRFASWLADYEHELLSFPDSTYKDQVDSTSQYLKWSRGSGRYGTRKLKGTNIKGGRK
jgi:predicted phage terminase large subunit-like protein